MLSRFRAINQMARWSNELNDHRLLQNIVSKRWSGHNTMKVKPSAFDYYLLKNLITLYFWVGLIPLSIITTIVNIRANPELIETPEGYEPLPHEYHKQPMARFFARFLSPEELDKELMMADYEKRAEKKILTEITRRVEKVMAFYNDHRSRFFRPAYGEYFRIGRDEVFYIGNLVTEQDGKIIDNAYDPNINPIPTEGYKPGDMQ